MYEHTCRTILGARKLVHANPVKPCLAILAVSCVNFAAGVFIKGDDMGGLVSDCVVVNVSVFPLHKMFFIPKGSDTKFLKVIFGEISKVEFCNAINP